MQKSQVTSLINSDERIQRTYQFHKKISNGCFGHLFLVTNKYTNRRAALKIEIFKTESTLTLKKEMHLLKRLEGVRGIPQVYNFGRTEHLLYMEMELLESDLSHFTQKSSKTDYILVQRLACELLRILSEVHSRNIIHRDLKPQNIMLDKNQNIYLIDFGISKEIVSNQPTPQRSSFVGTPRYASINAHKGKNQSPADDLESLMYNLIYICKKDLPWINVKTGGRNKLDTIMSIKMKQTKTELCRGLPRCFLMTFDYISSLKPEQKPNYEHLINLFKEYCAADHKIDLLTKVESSEIESIRHVKLVNPKPRRSSIEGLNFLSVPTQDFVIGSSQGTIDFQDSERAMRSCTLTSQPQLQTGFKEEEMEQNFTNEDTVEQRIMAIQKIPHLSRFQINLKH